MTSKYILDTLKQHIGEIKDLQVKRIGLFGSFLKGTATKESDVDFLVEFEKPTFDNYMDLKFLLERLFSKKVDVVTEDSLKPALAYVRREAHYVG